MAKQVPANLFLRGFGAFQPGDHASLFGGVGGGVEVNYGESVFGVLADLTSNQMLKGGERAKFNGDLGATFGLGVGNFRPYVGLGLGLSAFDGRKFDEQMRAGLMLTGGLSYALNQRWSLFGEYRHFDFGYVSDTNGSIHLSQDRVQIGVTYSFGSLW